MLSTAPPEASRQEDIMYTIVANVPQICPQVEAAFGHERSKRTTISPDLTGIPALLWRSSPRVALQLGSEDVTEIAAIVREVVEEGGVREGHWSLRLHALRRHHLGRFCRSGTARLQAAALLLLHRYNSCRGLRNAPRIEKASAPPCCALRR
eukprot:scaffold977_cov253-Pinguiococcus_pyrenoidosus.AAC.30